MTIKSLSKKLRTALLGTTFGLAGLGMVSTEGCEEALDAAALGFAIGQSLGESGAWDYYGSECDVYDYEDCETETWGDDEFGDYLF